MCNQKNRVEDFKDIYPYDDAQTREALGRVSRNPLIWVVSKYLFPDKPFWSLARRLRTIQTVEEFQTDVMEKAVKSVLDRTSDGLEVRGVENLSGKGRYLLVSNHRDIVMDPAIILYSVYTAGLPQTELCVGSNLLSSSFVEDIMRSNRLVKVYRGLPPHKMVEFSHLLSSYIRERITSGTSSVWIAQKEGRAKDSLDKTGQGLMKMLDLSGSGVFAADYDRLNVVPVSISYEYESCDALRARELLISRSRRYVKKKGEDLNSIKTGIKQKKGHICLTFCEPLHKEELEAAAALKGNERYKSLCGIIDVRIQASYRLWKTNYMGLDLLNGTSEHLGSEYSAEDLRAFQAYVQKSLKKYRRKLDVESLRQIFYSIYGNPVLSKQEAFSR